MSTRRVLDRTEVQLLVAGVDAAIAVTPSDFFEHATGLPSEAVHLHLLMPLIDMIVEDLGTTDTEHDPATGNDGASVHMVSVDQLRLALQCLKLTLMFADESAVVHTGFDRHDLRRFITCVELTGHTPRHRADARR
ncbi:hypothetical protein [Gordonia sp. OPL2]|uniref:hypothetical protein n=1 Tax=Gordonia sp. OPL2 TaxID=2486274 RepID=UPI0016564F29|nr:hypothetical protein [Gordonia sp. OPL2]